MKNVIILVLALLPGLTFAQIKPSVQKAEIALKAGKIDEAKSIIDATVGNQEYMVDKKGQPSKNAARAWYLKGVIYASIDTTKQEKFKILDPKPFDAAKEAFEKAKAIDGGKTDYFVTDKNGLPILPDVVNNYLAQSYFNQAIITFQEKKDYKRAFELTEQTLYFIPNDTAVIMNAGAYFGPAAKEWERSMNWLKIYFSKGGTGIDGYLMMFSIYRDQLKDNESALKTIREGMAKHPGSMELPKYEFELLVKMGKLPEAKASLEKQVAADPNDKVGIYYLGLISAELKDLDGAKKYYKQAIQLDPQYFDPRVALAEIVYDDAKKIKAQMNQLGITAEDKKKRFELDNTLVAKLKEALPYWQDCEKISPDDSKVLDSLLAIYSDLDMQPDVARITKKMKSLGLLD